MGIIGAVGPHVDKRITIVECVRVDRHRTLKAGALVVVGELISCFVQVLVDKEIINRPLTASGEDRERKDISPAVRDGRRDSRLASSLYS